MLHLSFSFKRMCIDVFAEYDEILEYNEEFALRIVPLDASVKPQDPNTTTITIIDNDCEFVLQSVKW